jgi:hypothetical protein
VQDALLEQLIGATQSCTLEEYFGGICDKSFELVYCRKQIELF